MEQRKRSRFTSRLLALMLSAVIMIGAMPVLQAHAESLAAWTTAAVNLRSGAGMSAAVIRVVSTGTQLTVTDTSNSAWYQVLLSDGTAGYISSDYIKTGPSGGGEGSSARTTVVVNLRGGPGTNYDVLALMSTGAIVTVLDTGNPAWYKVRTSGGAEGYIASEYLEMNGGSGPVETPTPPPPSGEAYEAQTTVAVNFRTAPGMGSTVTSVLATGTRVTVINTSDSSWYRVRLSSGAEGYVSAQYLQKSGGSEPEPAPPSGDAYEARTTAGVNFREAPGMGSRVITVLATGTKVTVINTSDSSWHRVRVASGTEGYVSSEYLQATGSTPPPAETVSEPYVATAVVNVRAGAGTSYSRITLIETGTAVTVTDKSQAPWFAVTLASGSKGYIHSDYLKPAEEAPPPSGDGSAKAVTTASVNLRKSAGTYSGVVTLVDYGTAVTVLEATNGQWHKVQLPNGTQGYLSTQYLRVTEGDTSALPSDPNYYYNEADAMARGVLNSVGYDLYSAYSWSAHALPYQDMSFSSADGYDPAQWYALYGFYNGRGNCYVMANTFYQMAKALGYNAHCVEGYVRRNDGSLGPHGWVEIDMDGGTYVFDPQFQHSYGRNGYQISYGASGTFQYADWHRIN